MRNPEIKLKTNALEKFVITASALSNIYLIMLVDDNMAITKTEGTIVDWVPVLLLEIIYSIFATLHVLGSYFYFPLML